MYVHMFKYIFYMYTIVHTTIAKYTQDSYDIAHVFTSLFLFSNTVRSWGIGKKWQSQNMIQLNLLEWWIWGVYD